MPICLRQLRDGLCGDLFFLHVRVQHSVQSKLRRKLLGLLWVFYRLRRNLQRRLRRRLLGLLQRLQCGLLGLLRGLYGELLRRVWIGLLRRLPGWMLRRVLRGL